MSLLKRIKYWIDDVMFYFFAGKKIKKSSFYPISNLESKKNYKLYYRIDKEGLILERIFLDISNMNIREQIIFLHFMKNEQKLFVKQKLGFNVLGRDNPWDFKVETSENDSFNLEITSIAENEKLFRNMKGEERFSDMAREKKVTLRELMKINSLFPNEKVSILLEKNIDEKVSKNVLVDNPYFGKDSPLFISTIPESEVYLLEIIKESIDKKIRKKHSENSNTILVIDNRTLSFEREEFHQVSKNLKDYLEKCVFREIWIYTGYFSNSDGNDAEFNFIPFKIGSLKKELLAKFMEDKPINDGILYT